MDVADDWLPRLLVPSLTEAMTDTPVVGLLGPRQCGKSALAQRAFPSRAYVTLDDPSLRETAASDPAGFIASLPDTVTLDEIQRAPALLPAIKMTVDRNRRPGRFLLTGSANLLQLPTVKESLAGRIALVRLHPLTEAEKERRPGRLLADLLAGELKGRVRPAVPEPSDLIDRLLRGGYPEAMRRPRLERVRQWHRDYVDAVVLRDAADVANLRDLDLPARLLELLALQTAELLKVESLAKLLAVRRETVQNHLAALERLFLVRSLPAWHANDSRRLVKAQKVHVVDCGLAASLAGLQAGDWLTRRDRFGQLLESFVVQQLSAQAGWTDPDLRFWHYRDKDQVEVDLVMTRGRMVWGVEIKAAATVSSVDGNGLRRLAERCGKHFQGGMLLYTGTSTLPTPDPRILAVPLSELWSR